MFFHFFGFLFEKHLSYHSCSHPFTCTRNKPAFFALKKKLTNFLLLYIEQIDILHEKTAKKIATRTE
jgi:hypothetical protein